MTRLMPNLTPDELAIANEVIRSTLILTAGSSPERKAMIATHVAAAITGVTMAVEDADRRARNNTNVLDHRSRTVFEEVKSRAYIHAFDERVNGPRNVHDVFRDWMGEGRLSKGDVAQRKLLAMS